jgi:carboxypeptidase Taq
MQELFGIQPLTDSEGCLQDIHWAEGLFGYFPSYALGHLISAQLAETMEQQLGGPGAIEAAIAAGQESSLRDWLASRVYPLGRSVNAEELVEQVSGQRLSAAAFLRYLRNKLERLRSDP